MHTAQAVVAAQMVRREAQIRAVGMGALAASHPTAPSPTQAGWTVVPSGGTFLYLSLFNPAFRAAYSAAKEVYVRGLSRMIYWRPWQFEGVWYATRRDTTMTPVTVFKFTQPARQMAGAAGAPADGLGALSAAERQGLGTLLARLAPYLDNDGYLDVDSFGYDPQDVAGTGAATGKSAAAILNPSLARWAALPIHPPANDPKWRAMSPDELSRIQGLTGWMQTIATATSQGNSIFSYRGGWFKLEGGTYYVLSAGSGASRQNFSLRGVAAPGGKRYPGMGATNASFAPPASLTATTMGPALSNALNALLTGYSAAGVPSMHVDDPLCRAFQSAWNADPIAAAAGGNALLDVDGGYGENSATAVAAINGGSAPPVNTISVPVPVVVTNPTTNPTTGTDWTAPLLIGAGVLAAGGLGTAAILHWQKKQKARRLTHAHT